MRPNGLKLYATCAAITLAVLAPVLLPGYVLVYDMVFTPRQPLNAEAFGLGSAIPRAVPVDALVAMTTTVVPGQIVQKLALMAILFGGALGAAKLVPSESTTVKIVAAVAYVWNAYVAERLFLGHWTLLLGYAALPWVAKAGLKLKKTGDWTGLVLASLPAVLSAPGGILALGTALATAGRKKIPHVLAIGIVLNAPWWVPSLLHNGLSDPAGVAAFSARGENWGGPLLSVLGLGGVWNAEVVPDSRANPVLPVITVVLTAIALIGLRRVPFAKPLIALGAFGFVIAVAANLPGGTALLGYLIDHVPGAGLLRDSQKWVAWWALPFALGLAMAAERLKAKLVVPVLLIALLPDLAWGGFGRLEPVDYPAEWSEVRDLLVDQPGDVAVLPAQAFRRFDWNDRRTQLDPAPRFLPGTTVVEDSLQVGGKRISGEDPRARDLATLDGFGWVLVEYGTPGRVDPNLLARLEKVHDGPELALYRVPGGAPNAPDGPPVAPVVLAWIAAGSLICASLLWRWLLVGRFLPPQSEE
ncbi:hypothetical protein Lesp02_08440 [Lentzea sp. NBRC 105346]|uniref:hypothetical protein n=1 Tax=Lentzea sp. NBRC 105346 TaxID=3032205 RepID=UPI0024A3D1A1|nr:hypothetical protein [Lentzea sp. NBRC 105346]GLZ28654.1 hypothetical protein Lesp02_08440 [Lentzea sp. NBRC 105346]